MAATVTQIGKGREAARNLANFKRSYTRQYLVKLDTDGDEDTAIDAAISYSAYDLESVAKVETEDCRRWKNVFLSGLTLPQVVRLISQADLICGPDSFPIHMAGTLGVKTLCLLGPTRPTLFHYDNFHTLTGDRHCTGCSFSGHWNMVCRLGCVSLFGLDPQKVIDKIKSLGG